MSVPETDRRARFFNEAKQISDYPFSKADLKVSNGKESTHLLAGEPVRFLRPWFVTG